MLLVFVISILLGLIPAFIARSKGHDFLVYWVTGSVVFAFTVAYTIFMPKAGEPDRPGTALKSIALGILIFAAWFAVARIISPPISL